MLDRSQWRITSARTYASGTTYGTNIDAGNGTSVSVKHRSGKGKPYICLSCLKNLCPHIVFIIEQEHHATTHDAAR